MCWSGRVSRREDFSSANGLGTDGLRPHLQHRPRTTILICRRPLTFASFAHCAAHSTANLTTTNCSVDIDRGREENSIDVEKLYSTRFFRSNAHLISDTEFHVYRLSYADPLTLCRHT